MMLNDTTSINQASKFESTTKHNSLIISTASLRRRRNTELSHLKTSKGRNQMAEDRITALPESLLVHILSFLPIRDAIKTEVLSKRWRFLWTFLSSLIFSYRGDENEAFIAFVEKTLVLCNSSKVKEFMVNFEYEPRFASNVSSWIRFATGKGVEELYLVFDAVADDLNEDKRFKLPQVLYANSSFKALYFSLCRVMPKGVVAWNSLKELSIGYAKLSDDVIEKILEGSPVLEVLEFYNYGGFSRLHITNTSVKKLVLREFWDGEGDPFRDDDESDEDGESEDSEEGESDGEHEDSEEDEDDGEYSDYVEDGSDGEHDGDSEEDEVDGEHDEDEALEISAPYLQILAISGRLPRNFQLTNLPSLVDADLDFNSETFEDYSDEEETLSGLLQSLVHVKRLTLDACTAQFERDRQQAQEKMECQDLSHLLQEENEMLKAENTDLNKEIIMLQK